MRGRGPDGPLLGNWRWSLLAAVLGLAFLGYAYWSSGDALYLIVAAGYAVALAMVVRLARM